MGECVAHLEILIASLMLLIQVEISKDTTRVHDCVFLHVCVCLRAHIPTGRKSGKTPPLGWGLSWGTPAQQCPTRLPLWGRGGSGGEFGEKVAPSLGVPFF